MILDITYTPPMPSAALNIFVLKPAHKTHYSPCPSLNRRLTHFSRNPVLYPYLAVPCVACGRILLDKLLSADLAADIICSVSSYDFCCGIRQESCSIYYCPLAPAHGLRLGCGGGELWGGRRNAILSNAASIWRMGG